MSENNKTRTSKIFIISILSTLIVTILVQSIVAAPTETQAFRLANTIQLSTSTPTIVQNTFATFTTGTSGSVAFSSNVGVKNTIIVCQGQSGTSAFNTANNVPTDTLGLTYILLVTIGVLNGAMMVCFSAETGNGGADTVTSATFAVTCAAGNLCTLFINEIKGSSRGMIFTKTGSSSSAVTSATCPNLGSSQTPLLLAFYQKLTTGTDTAGASFNLLNGETGNLLYLTEFSNTLTHVFTTWPATFGTATEYAGICFTVPEATVAWTTPLAANSNYYFSINGGLGTPANGGGITVNSGFTIGQLDTGASLVLLCQYGISANNQGCTTTTDNYPLTNGGIVAAPSITSYSLWGTIIVGAKATTLTIYFDCSVGNGASVPACQLNAGSIVLLTSVT